MKKIIALLVTAALLLVPFDSYGGTAEGYGIDSNSYGSANAGCCSASPCGYTGSSASEAVIQSDDFSGNTLPVQGQQILAATPSIGTTIVNGWESGLTSIDISSYRITKTGMGQVYAAVLNSNPDCFYVDTYFRYSYNSSGYVIAVMPRYLYSGTTLSYMKSTYADRMDKLLSGVDDSWSDMEKALYVHDYIATHCEYDTNYRYYSAYDVMVRETAVCQGYALAYIAALNRLDIDAYFVTGPDINHGWNLIKINGKYYYVDVTWDDPIGDVTGRCYHDYFMKSEADCAEAHDSDSSTWTISAPSIGVDRADDAYDDYFWDDVKTSIVNAGGSWFVLAEDDDSQGVIKKYSCNGTDFSYLSNISTVSEIWYSWGSTSSYYPGTYSRLSAYGGSLYYSTPQSVWRVAPDGTGAATAYELTESEKALGYIYGAYVDNDGLLKYELMENPNEGDGAVYSRQLDTDSPWADSISVALGYNSCTYTGYMRRPSVTVTDGERNVLVNGVDYTLSYRNNINAGIAEAVVVGLGENRGVKITPFTITRKSVSSMTASLSATKFTYSGVARRPIVTISGLSGGTDFKVSYINTVRPGYGTVKITGTGNYTGTISRTITIRPTVTAKFTASAGYRKAYLAWRRCSYVSGYQVYMATSKSGTYRRVATLGSTKLKYTKRYLSKGRVYYFKVRAYKKTVLNGKTSYIYGNFSSARAIRAE